MTSSSNNFDNVFATQPPPAHYTHNSSDVLPGARGGDSAPNYSTDVTEDARVWETNNERRFGAGTDTTTVMAGAQHRGGDSALPSMQDNSFAHDAHHEERPLNVQPTSAGGVALDGRDDLPEGHANMTDKLIGKTQKVAGKMLHKPEMHEKGELREAGGKDAAAGRARAPHD